MLLVATISPDEDAAPAHGRDQTPRRPQAGGHLQATRRMAATLARLARLHDLVVVADWPEHGQNARGLVDALSSALPWHEVVLVATRADGRRRHAGAVGNLPTVRRLIDDGALVVCLAAGPSPRRTEQVATALAGALHADRLIRLPHDEPATNGPGRPVAPATPDSRARRGTAGSAIASSPTASR
jgi:hypothetical protein